MNASDVALLFDHVYWMRDKLLAASDDLSVPFETAAAQTQRDLRATLVHELDVEWSWRVRLSREDRTEFAPDDEELKPDDFPRVASLREAWAEDETDMRAWLASMTDADLAGPCRAESEGSHPFWYHLQHLYTHAIQQFSDAATILSALGHSPGELDFLQFVEERERT